MAHPPLVPAACVAFLFRRFLRFRGHDDVAYSYLNAEVADTTSVDPLDRSYDIVFSYYDGDLPGSGRVARRVFELRRGIFASPEFLQKYSKVKTPADLAELPAIASPADAEWTFTDAKGSYSVPVRARMRSPNADVRRRATLEGLGVSRIVLTFCEAHVREGRLRPLLADYVCAPLRIYALLPGRRLVPPKVRTFLGLLDGPLLLVQRLAALLKSAKELAPRLFDAPVSHAVSSSGGEPPDLRPLWLNFGRASRRRSSSGPRARSMIL